MTTAQWDPNSDFDWDATAPAEGENADWNCDATDPKEDEEEWNWDDSAWNEKADWN